MKKFRSAVIIAAVAVLLTGCSNPITTLTMITRDRSTVYVQDNGKVAGIFFEKFDKEYYDEDELKEYIDREVSDQNARLGEKNVQISYFKVKNDLAKLGLMFADLESYNTFNTSNLVLGTTDEMMERLKEEGISSFYTTDGKRIKQKDMELEDTYTLLVDENIQVKIDGKILYTTKNVTMHESHEDEALMPGDGYHCIIYQPEK